MQYLIHSFRFQLNYMLLEIPNICGENGESFLEDYFFCRTLFTIIV